MGQVSQGMRWNELTNTSRDAERLMVKDVENGGAPGGNGLSKSYMLAVEDTDFLLRDEMRAFRFGLEFAKAELTLRDWGIRSTIIVFGSARIPSPEQVEAAQAAAQAPEELERVQWMRGQLRYYDTAREFARIASERGGAFAPRNRWRDNVIATGGGPGIMEAANRGAADVRAPSIGFNITLPHEQHPNPYSTPELTLRFHYFAMRKMHLAMRANALAIFPGGYGTLDELFEVLTLQQTGKAPRIPIVLFGKSYWQRIINFDALAEEGAISPEDLKLFEYADTAEEGWESLVRRGITAMPPG
ncbi:cytokinin riboside 5'-monophosphate phosphoribohydrolase [Camelimonas fluminis]|nr:cytokinin riboside 5'-monophosphate phosphoribohydrolase [Camelimonas fluminis]